jgi:hypothetical protein
MTQQNILEQAKQGNAQAIADLMNRTLQPKGITAKASLKDDCLRVMLESEQVPNEQMAIAFVEKGMKGLGVRSIHRVQIYGRQAGEELPAWNHELSLSEPPIEPVEQVKEQIESPQPQTTQKAATPKTPSTLESIAGLVFMVFLFGGCVYNVGKPWNCEQAREELAKAEDELKSDNYESMNGDRAYIAVRGNMHQVAMKQDKVYQKCH